MKVCFRIACSALLFLATAVTVSAHEFWINPLSFQVEPGAQIRADFRNGEEFDGTQLAYFGRSSKRLIVAGPDGVKPLQPRDGDRPAINFRAKTPGLYVLGHETKSSGLTYKTWDKWQKFIKHKDLTGIAASHESRGLPRENFREGYTRHVKALVAVGNGAGKDRRLGMATEFVALTNPFDAGYGGTMQAQLYYDGTVRPNAQVEVFERAPGGSVKISLLRTNGSGVVALKTKPGYDYLIDAVVLREPRGNDPKIVWETLWAALTFTHP